MKPRRKNTPFPLLSFALAMLMLLGAAGCGQDPVDACFAGHPLLLLKSATAEKKVRNGTPLTVEAPDGTYRVYSREQEFLALARLQEGRLTTIKSFFEV